MVDALDVAHAPAAAKRRMGILPDRFGLYPHLSAREHLEFFGRLQGVPTVRLAERLEEIRSALDMGSYFERPAQHLSLGQGMKVALGRAILHDPGNIVMDEPTRGLDILAVRTLRDILRALRDQGRAIFITNHSMLEVETISDRVLVLAGGAIVADGTSQDICRQTGTSTLEEGFVRLSTMGGIDS